MTPVDRDPSSGLNGAVAAVLRAERAASSDRMTQDELAAAAGMPVVSLRRYLNAQRHIDVAVLGAICDAMGLDPQWVVAQAEARRGPRVDYSFGDRVTGSGGFLASAHDELEDKIGAPSELEEKIEQYEADKAARTTSRRGSIADTDGVQDS